MRVIIDTDAGVDDAVALMLAAADPAAQVEAITTVTGNIDVDRVILNVMSTLKVMNREDIPVYRGAEVPLVSSWKFDTAHIHGSDGYGDWAGRPKSKKTVEPEHAVNAMLRLANQYPGEITLIALGPMTNIALATRLDPSFPSKIARLVWMGGAIYGMGNSENIAAEFNVFIDPEAAYITLAAFPNSIMVSWETSLKCAIKWEDYDTLAAITSNPVAQCFRGITAFFRRLAANMPQMPGYIAPDPLAVAVALHPELITNSEHHFMAVELGGTHARGSTPVDMMNFSRNPPNVHIVLDVNMAAFTAMLRRMITTGKL